MSVKREEFGVTENGEQVNAYIVDNGKISFRVIDYGAALVNVVVPDALGRKADVALGWNDVHGYEHNHGFMGALVGPSCNRIAGAEFEIDGKEIHLPVNDGPNNLHTDKEHGLNRRMWKALPGEDFVMFSIHLDDGDLCLPGNREICVTYSVLDDDGVQIHYHATSDQKTIFNFTNHSYWNLDGHAAGSILRTKLQLNCSHFTPVREGSIPTGEIRAVAGTPFDFTQPKEIGRDIDADDPQLAITGGYDHNFCIDGYDGEGTICLAARAQGPASGRVMEVQTNTPGVQFYTANFLNNAGCKEGRTYGPREAFCLETQFYPDSVHHSNFPQPIFGGDTVYDTITIYRFPTGKA
ncbi:MAG: galactose mutarotase [Lachnospiraceae bacterium]|nr:galactose mutarotase [Lachnospiraceae bacterium]